MTLSNTSEFSVAKSAAVPVPTKTIRAESLQQRAIATAFDAGPNAQGSAPKTIVGVIGRNGCRSRVGCAESRRRALQSHKLQPEFKPAQPLLFTAADLLATRAGHSYQLRSQ